MKKSPLFMIVAAASLWGTIGIFVKKLYSFGFSAIELVAARAIITALLLFIFLFITKRDALKIKLKDSKYFIGTGIISFVFFNYCYFKAMEVSSLSVAAILLYTAPIFVMLFSLILFKENITSKKLVSLILTFLGCCLVSGIFSSSQSVKLSGIVYGLGAGLGYSLYSIFARYALQKYESLTVTFYTFVFASVGVLFLCDARHVLSLVTSPHILIWLFSSAIMTTVLPYLLYTKGLSETQSSKAAITASLEPVVASIISVFVFHELMPFMNLIGIFVIVFAIFILNFKPKQLSKIK